MWNGSCNSYTKVLYICYHDKEDLCCVKVDFQNAFNECRCLPFLSHLKKGIAELFPWVQWSYHTFHPSGDFRFENVCILSTAGVQQRDPLGPLLFSLVVSQLLDDFGKNSGPNFNFDTLMMELLLKHANQSPNYYSLLL